MIALAAGEVAVLGGVRDRVAHAGDALLVHQVDDQLELVQALEVRQARVVARLDERLVAGPDQLGDAAAEHGLLAEQVGLRLVLEGGLDHARARAADALARRRARGRGRCRVASWWMATRPGHAVALHELAAHEVAGALRGDHARRRPPGRARSGRSGSRSRGRTAAGCRARCRRGSRDSQTSACFSSGSSTITTSPRLAASATRVTRRPSASALADRVGVRAQADHHVHAGVLQVERVGVALGAVAEDGHGLAVELREVGVLVVDHRARDSSGAAGGRARAFPAALRGSSSTTRPASGPCAAPGARGRMRAAPPRSPAPRSTTNAATASPHSGSGTPSTAGVGHGRMRAAAPPPPRARRHVLAAGHDQVLDPALARAGARRASRRPRSPVWSQPSSATAPARHHRAADQHLAVVRRSRARRRAARARAPRPRTCERVSVIP